MNMINRCCMGLFLIAIIAPASSASHKKLSKVEAIQRAEKFIVDNGYTTLPPMKDLSKLTPMFMEWSNDRKEWLKRRRGTLDSKAYAYMDGRKGGEPGWTVIFCGLHDTLRKYGTAVTMDLDGSNTHVEHVPAILKFFKRIDNKPRSSSVKS